MYGEDTFERAYSVHRRNGRRAASAASRRREHEVRLLRMCVIAMVILACVLIIFIRSSARKADAVSMPTYKYYTSVEVNQGDSLWSIAEDHMSSGYKDTADLVDEIASINHLHDDCLDVGQKIIVPYYSTEYRD